MTHQVCFDQYKRSHNTKSIKMNTMFFVLNIGFITGCHVSVNHHFFTSATNEQKILWSLIHGMLQQLREAQILDVKELCISSYRRTADDSCVCGNSTRVTHGRWCTRVITGVTKLDWDTFTPASCRHQLHVRKMNIYMQMYYNKKIWCQWN